MFCFPELIQHPRRFSAPIWGECAQDHAVFCVVSMSWFCFARAASVSSDYYFSGLYKANWSQ